MIERIFEDNHLFVLNKPAGLLTQASGLDRQNLEQMAKDWLKQTYNKPGQVFLEVIHRLDKPVSGVIVFAKTSKALSRLNLAMRSKKMRKIYWAWVEGAVLEEKGELQDVLYHDEFHARVVETDHPEGKIARLQYTVLQRKEKKTLVEIEIETGRYHQIRAQLAHAGHPIIGDYKYGAVHKYEADSIALHHRRLELPHPVTNEMLVFEAPVPVSFNQL